MSWTYSSPLSGDKDIVRYLVGDTVEGDPLASDEEILYQLTQYPETTRAAAEVAEAISRKFGRQADMRTPDLAVSFSERAKTYATLAKQLRTDAETRGAMPYAGGISASDMQAREEDTDRVAPAFTRQTADDEPPSSRQAMWEC